MLKQVQLAYRQWLREVTRGEWTMTLLSLILAVTAISSMQFITNRIEQGLIEQSAKLLGGNIAIRSNDPIPDTWQQLARKHQLRSSSVIDTQTMLNINNRFTLVSLQAVSQNYPLYGSKLTIENKHALADKALVNQLNLNLPATIKLGKANFKLSAIVPPDLELTYTSWLLAPRVIIRSDDLKATEIVVPGSRATYRFLLAGKQANIDAFTTEIKPLLTSQQRLFNTSQQRFRLLNNLHQIDQYLQLTIMFSILMCGIAIVLSMQQYVKKHYKNIALWCLLGAKHSQIRQVYLLQLILTALLAGLIGSLIGYLLHLNLLDYLTSYLKISLPSPSLQTYTTGFAASVVLLFCSSFPILEHLIDVQPLALWRENTKTPSNSPLLPIFSLGFFVLFLLWMMHFSILSFIVISSLFIVTGLFVVLMNYFHRVLKPFAANKTGAIKRGFSQIIQYPLASSIQIGAFSLIIILVLVLTVLKSNLLNQWQDAIRKESPNYFSFNITKNDLPRMNAILEEYNARATNFYPMIKGRLTTINDQDVHEGKQRNKEHNALNRDLYLTSSMQYPKDNTVINGKQWSAKDKGKAIVSIEESLATALAAKPGDKLGFIINGSLLEATISNIRTVEWSSLHPNFYIIFPADTFKNIPATYIVSFYLPQDADSFVRTVASKMPNVTVIDMADTLQKIQTWINQAATAIQGLFIFSFFASIIVMIAAFITTMDERKEAARLIRLLGGTKLFVLKSQFTELAVIITLSAAIGISLSILISKVIMWFIA